MDIPNSTAKKVDRGTLTIGDFDQFQEQENIRWRNMTIQERTDQYVALMGIWKADEPRLVRTFTITTIPHSKPKSV